MVSGRNKRMDRVELRLILDTEFLKNRHQLLAKTAARVLRLPHINDPEAVRALPGDVGQQTLDRPVGG
jgi:hypothetical protein